MSYKNSLKLLASNFTLVWKQLAFMLISIIICFFCSYSFISPVISVLKENGAFGKFSEIFKDLFTLKSISLTDIINLPKSVLTSLWKNFTTIYLDLIGVCVFGFILPYILILMSKYNLGNIINKKITMNMSTSYILNGFSNFWKSLKYAFMLFAFTLPFIIAKIAVVVLFFILAKSLFMIIVLLFLSSLINIMLDSLKTTIFAYFTGEVVSSDTKYLKSFKNSIKVSFKHFGKIFSNCLLAVLSVTVVNGFVALFTFSAGLIVSVPMSFVFITILEVVIYLNINSQRYYLDHNIIFNPSDYIIKKDESKIEVNFQEFDVKKSKKKNKRG